MKKNGNKIISISLIVAMLLTTVACGGSSEAGVVKKKKKVIRHHKAESSADNSSSSGNGTDYSGDSYYDEDNNYYIPPSGSSGESGNDNSSEDDTTKNPVVSLPKYEVELDGRGYSDANARIGMGLYHYSLGQMTEVYGDAYDEFSFLNTGGNEGEAILLAKENNGTVWCGPGNPYDSRDTLQFREGYTEALESLMQQYKDAGFYDQIAGFHMDEYCLKMTGEQFRLLTKYLAETFPGKRIFPVLSYYEVVNSAPPEFIVGEFNYENYGYVTDIGFDWYTDTDINKHRELLKIMKETLGRDDVRIWFFPSTFDYGGSLDETHMLKHLNMCYELLKEEKNPGGLWCYTWKTFESVYTGTTVGLKDLIDPDLKWKYNKLMARVVEIGKEINNNSYRYNVSKN